VSAYPEVHPESRRWPGSRAAGAEGPTPEATRAITQFCFLTDRVARFRDCVDRAGINVPIVPGIMPATNFAAVARMARLCGATIPSWLAERFDGLDDDPQTRALIAAIIAARQIEELRCEGFEQFHFYTLNQADVVTAVCRLLESRARRPGAPGGMSVDTDRSARIAALHEAAARRILVLDGSWGAKIQDLRLTEEQFRGERFADHPHHCAATPTCCA